MFYFGIWISFSSCLSEDRQKYTVAVVLVTRQIVLAAANEIDKLPKDDFRARARVILGHNCTGPSVRIRDYTYHPDYAKNTYSTFAIIRLETDIVKIKLRPICPPPTHFRDQNFFAMVLSNNCKQSRMRIHKMNFVTTEQCRSYYRRSGLGFGVYGPGCQAPARFLDYGMYHNWVTRSIERIGRPTVTALAENHVVLRRSQSNIQRFGPCDQEDTALELFCDETYVSKENLLRPNVITHNVTLVADVEYSCVIFKADYIDHKGKNDIPKLRLQRWCAGGIRMCHGFGFIEIKLTVEITFERPIKFRVAGYGKVANVIHQENAYLYYKHRIQKPRIIDYYHTALEFLWWYKGSSENQSFGKGVLLPYR